MPDTGQQRVPRCRRMSLCSWLPATRVSAIYTASMRSPLPVMRSGADEMVRSCGESTPSSGHSLMTRPPVGSRRGSRVVGLCTSCMNMNVEPSM